MPAEPSWWYLKPGMLARVLSPVAAVYGAVSARRMSRQPAFVSKLPVLCVGNFTAGGAGKTPATAMIVRMLHDMGRKPAVLARGYGGRAAGPVWVDPSKHGAADVGDEPLLHANVAPTMVARDRIAGARAIEADRRCDVIVMDDGLQNPRLKKTASVAVVDGQRGLGNGFVIPAGPLRAPLAAQIATVDAVIVNGGPSPDITETLSTMRAAVPVIAARLVPVAETEALAGRRVVAFAGIGHPQRFFETVAALGAEVVARVPFPDHRPYSAADADALIALGQRHAAILVTTAKDAARLRGHTPAARLAQAARAISVEMHLEPGDGAVAMEALLRRIIER